MDIKEIESMTAHEVRNIKFEDCQICKSLEVCESTTVKECRELIKGRL